MSNESEKTKIVVIDDEEGLLTLLKRGLMRPGRFDVAITSNPLEAETLCREFEPDILLLDVVMPQRNGPEIVRSF
ncbi:MAG: response regulator [Candidatus Omnitrophica bacterium]|nr:response regulator [Candidatus Omnitrophota bacterium]